MYRRWACVAGVVLLCSSVLLAGMAAFGPSKMVAEKASFEPVAATSLADSARTGALNTAEMPQAGPNVTAMVALDKKLATSNTGEPIAEVAPGHMVPSAPTAGREFTFDLTPGIEAPPEMLCGQLMTPFPPYDDDPPPGSAALTSVPSPCPYGDIEFSIPLSHRRIQGADGYTYWGSWSHGYTGDVYYTEGALEVTITLPQPQCEFYFYVESNSFGLHEFEVIANGVDSSGIFEVEGSSGAQYVGVCGEGLTTITVIGNASTSGFCIGEFGQACFCEPVYVACCDEATGICTDDPLVEIMDCIAAGGRFEVGVEDCDLLDPLCGSQMGACCVGPVAEPPYDPYECIGDMPLGDCLALGEETNWSQGASCADPGFLCPGTPTYCDGSGGCDEFISRVEFGDIDNTSVCDQYADYTSLVAMLIIGVNQDITVTNGNYYTTDITTVWIDWNQDKDWDDDGEMLLSGDPGGEIFTGTVVVPPTALPGYTRMRIRMQYGGEVAPCGTTTYGEVEDYSVLVTGDVPTGSCCNPFDGTCTNDVLATECLSPLQFGYEMTCETLDPPCGNAGCCCDDVAGTVTEEFELNCLGRFLPGVLGGDCFAEAYDPPCGEANHYKMLYMPTEADNAAFRAEIAAITVSDCDYFDPRTAVPTLAQLMEYQCVFTWVNYAYSDPIATGDILADYLEAGGKVILGQWTADSGQTNKLAGRIMDEYELVILSGRTLGTYAGDGTTCIHTGVAAYTSDYWDDIGTVVAPAMVDGTRTDGLPSVVWAPVMNQFYSGGNTGNTYSSGDWAQLTANMCMCVPPELFGACCDPATGLCNEDVAVADCMPPLQFHLQMACDEFFPPCGNPGACCNPFDGTCTDPVLELDCPDGYRFEPGGQCGELEPECGTPGCCCDEDAATVTQEFAANCAGRFLPGVIGGDCLVEAFDPPCGEWTCGGILYAPTNPDNADFRAALAAMTGTFVDYYDPRAGTPTLEDIQDYCMILTWGNYAYADAVAFGDVLADFVDGNGKVVLGQWTYHTTQTNWLEGRIMEPGYCPITATGYTGGTYAGDGTDCIHCAVGTYASDYRDQCTVAAGAVSDGTFAEDGLLAVAWRADRRVYYSPGNTGGDFGTGDWARLTANIYACSTEFAFGACCDPFTGQCTDAVECQACPPTSQFFIDGECALLDPPCGNEGCCCDDATGEVTVMFEILCNGRFMGGVLGEDCVAEAFEPGCGDGCVHSITMWDDWGDGWNGGFIDVFVDGTQVFSGLTLATGAGPETVEFFAGNGSEIVTVFTAGGWPYECSYCIYGLGGELIACDGEGGVDPVGLTVYGMCQAAVCGDGICNGDETCLTCPEDCGECECLSQPPNASNGIFSDIDCDYCGSGPIQINIENFVMLEPATIYGLQFWGGYYPGNLVSDPDVFMVIFREDAGGTPGAEIASYGPVAGTRAATGVVLFGVDEYVYNIDIPALAFAAGTYWVEIYNDTSDTTDSWFWEVGDLDPDAGVAGVGFTFTLPEEPWSLDAANNFALEIICDEGGPWCDVDNDGDVDGDDYVLFLMAFGTEPGDPNWLPAADWDLDGRVTLVDWQAFRLCYLEENPPLGK